MWCGFLEGVSMCALYVGLPCMVVIVGNAIGYLFFLWCVAPRRNGGKNKRIHLSSVIKSVVCFHSGDAVPKLSSTDVSSDEPRLLLYLNKEISTSLQTGEKEWFKFFFFWTRLKYFMYHIFVFYFFVFDFFSVLSLNVRFFSCFWPAALFIIIFLNVFTYFIR